MNEKKKSGRWAKSLDKAGLLDPIENGWEIPEKDGTRADTIVVKKKRSDAPPSTDSPESPTIDSSAIEASVKSSPPTTTTTRTTDPASPLEMTTDELRRQMDERFEVGDYSGALNTAERLLAVDDNAEDASIVRLKCRNTLMQMFESRIGSFKRIPRRLVSEEEIVWRNLDAVSAFIASNVEGTLSFEDIVDISTVSRFDTCRILSQLLQEGIIK
jgi:hypothetical protein